MFVGEEGRGERSGWGGEGEDGEERGKGEGGCPSQISPNDVMG